MARIVFGTGTFGLGALWLFFPFTKFLKAVVAISVPTLGLLGYHFSTETTSKAWEDVKTIAQPVMDFTVLGASQAASIIGPLKDIANSLYNFRTCRHTGDCGCPASDNVNGLLDDLANTRNELAHQNVLNHTLTQRTRQQANEINKLHDHPPNRPNTRNEQRWTGWQPGSPPAPSSPQSPRTRNLQAEVERLTDVIAELTQLRNVQEKKCETRINNLKAQLGYARGDAHVKADVDALRVRLRETEEKLNKASYDLFHHRLQEGKENTSTGPKSCGDEARCQAIIGKLERDKEVLLQTHRDNDVMVQQAAREFGKSENEARHVTVRSYLQELTQAMVQQIASGGFGNVQNRPVFANIASNMEKARIREMEAYKNRLEDEVERLGGNVQNVKMGLVIKLPYNKYLHYKDLDLDPFDIYLRLCEAVRVVTDVFENDFGRHALLPWNHGPPRAEIANRRVHIQVIDPVDRKLNVVRNLKYEQYERLIHSLLHQEIARLYNRLVDFRRDAEENKRAFTQASMAKLEGKGSEIRSTMKAVLAFMSDQREIQKCDIPLTEPIKGIAADLRYKIWIAMQEAIDHLQLAIESFNSKVPPWRIPVDIQPQSFQPTKTFPELVTRVLRFEINALDDRIHQLIDYMEAERFPGTKAGQPRLAGPPKYQADFDALTAAVSYGRLCRGHWWDEVYPDQVARPRMPLDHPPLLHAVRRETGDLLIPNVNPFPWKLQVDGRLQDARIIEPNSRDRNAELMTEILLNPNATLKKYVLPPIADSELEFKHDDAGNPIFLDFGTEKRWYWKYYNRKHQLLMWIKASGQQPPWLHENRFQEWFHNREGPNMGLIRAKKRELAECVRDLTGWVGERGVGVPEWPYKGGKMEPDVEPGPVVAPVPMVDVEKT